MSCLDEYVKDARAQKEGARGRIVAMWAGIEAAKTTPVPACPFRDDEAELVAGFQRGLSMAARRHHPADVKTLRLPAARATYAAHSAPKDEEGE